MCFAFRVTVTPAYWAPGNLDRGMLYQLGDHRVRIRVRPAVQFLHKLRDAEVGSFHPAWVVHRHRPIIVHG